MKVFVYSKKTNRKLATITSVVAIRAKSGESTIQIIADSGETFEFNTKVVKTTAYQN